MQARLDKVAANENKDEKKQQYSTILTELMATEDKKNLQIFVQHSRLKTFSFLTCN
jgi:hypothetical protein